MENVGTQRERITPSSPRPAVAIVDDDAQVRQVFTAALQDDYRVLEADSGEAALELVDDVDVVLLDRKMSGLSGREVLDRLRAAGIDVPVAMLTVVQPDFDILGMGFDDYVLKPIEMATLREVVERLLLVKESDEAIREYFAQASMIASLRSAKDSDRLAADERFVRAERRLEELEERARCALDRAVEPGRFDELLEESASTKRTLEDDAADDDPERR